MQDPNAQFDQAVLELIEHSPTGSLPGTPAYQDALKRLASAHQVYASADYKGGYVTARSLATKPSFHASDLEAVLLRRASLETLESNAAIYDRYVQSLPVTLRERAESLRLRAAGRPSHHRVKHTPAGAGPEVHDPVHTLLLVPGTGPHPGLPGNYLYGAALQLVADPAAPWAIELHDCDDGVANCELGSMADAYARVVELIDCAPFTMDELEALGFQLN